MYPVYFPCKVRNWETGNKRLFCASYLNNSLEMIEFEEHRNVI